MDNTTFIRDKDGVERWWKANKLMQVREPDGRVRVYAYHPKAHLEYVRLKNGEEWYSKDGQTAKPDLKGGTK
jgi:hypothetical protein